MFNNQRYVTQGITNTVPLVTQIILWDCIDSMKVERKDYLQVFKLVANGNNQQVMHSQEEPSFEVSCNLAYGIDWSDPDNVAILDRELHKLIDFYIANPQITPCSMLSMGITNVLLEDKRPHRHCGAGIEMTSYDVDGRSYPCQFFMPLSVGEEKASKAKDLKFYEDFIPSELADEKCRDCVINRCCPNCYGSNYASYQRLFQKAYQYIRSIVLFFYMVNIHFCQVNKVNFSEYSVETRECCDYYIMKMQRKTTLLFQSQD